MASDFRDEEVRIEFEVRPSAPRKTLRFVVRRGVITEIRVRGTAADGNEQVIETGAEDAYTQPFAAGDYDFDGYKDIRLLIASGGTGNQQWKVWLFDPTTKTFVFDAGLSALGTVTFDPARKEIVSYDTGGDGGALRSVTRRGYVDGALVVLRSFEQSQGTKDGEYVREIRERRAGKLERTQRCVLHADDLDDADTRPDPPCPEAPKR
jgi:hypothetical protein